MLTVHAFTFWWILSWFYTGENKTKKTHTNKQTKKQLLKIPTVCPHILEDVWNKKLDFKQYFVPAQLDSSIKSFIKWALNKSGT